MKLSIAILTAVATLALAGCASYQSFPKSEAASQRVHDAIAAQSAELDSPDYPDPVERQQRLRYLARVIAHVNKVEQQRADHYIEKLSPADAEQLDSAVAILLRTLETLARFPGQLDENNQPADPATATALADAPDVLTDP